MRFLRPSSSRSIGGLGDFSKLFSNPLTNSNHQTVFIYGKEKNFACSYKFQIMFFFFLFIVKSWKENHIKQQFVIKSRKTLSWFQTYGPKTDKLQFLFILSIMHLPRNNNKRRRHARRWRENTFLMTKQLRPPHDSWNDFLSWSHEIFEEIQSVLFAIPKAGMFYLPFCFFQKASQTDARNPSRHHLTDFNWMQTEKCLGWMENVS